MLRSKLLIYIGIVILTFSGSNLYSQEFYQWANIRQVYERPHSGIQSSTVNDFYQDVSGLLWIAGPEGITVSDGVDYDEFPPSVAGRLPNPMAANTLTGDSSHVFAATSSGIAIIEIQSRRYQVLHREMSFQAVAVNNGVMMAATADRVYKFIKSKNVWLDLAVDSFDLKGCHQILALQSWHFASNEGLWTIEEAVFSRSYEEYLPDTIWSILPLPESGGLHCGTPEGIYTVFSKQQTELKILPSSYPDIPGAANKILSLEYVDEHRLWAGTSGGGVLELILDQDGCSSVNVVPGLSSLYVYSLTRTSDRSMWVGTAWQGLFRIDLPDESFRSVKLGASVWDIIENPRLSSWLVLSDNIIQQYARAGDQLQIESEVRGMRAILPLLAEQFIVAGEGQDILIIDDSLRTELYVRLQAPESTMDNIVIQDLIRSTDGSLWAIGNLGLCRIRKDLQQDWYFYPGDTLISNFYCAALSSENSILFGSHNGLFEFDMSTENFRLWKREPGVKGSLTINKVISVLVDSRGTRWIGTLGGGLNKQLTGEEEFTFLTKADGLPDNVITSLNEDDQGYIWIGTNSGLCRLDPQSSEIITYSSENGLPDMELNIGASYVDHKGQLWVGSRSGLAVSDTSLLQLRSKGPALCIQALYISGQDSLFGITRNRSFTLNPGQNSISIDFTSLSFSHPFRKKYRYMLEGYDTEWTSRGSGQSIAEYKRLAPGDYRFVLYGSDHQGFWSVEPLVLSFSILKPWYQRWWFRTIAILLPLLIIAWIWINRIRSLRRKHQIQMQIVEAEKQALRLQMNPHFIFNSLNSIQGFVVQEKKDQAVEYLAKFSHLMRLILNNSRETFVPIKDELSALRHYLDIEQLRFSKSFEYSINIDPSIDIEFTGIPPMLIQPYVENAILHGLLPKGGDGRISIRILKDAQGLLIEIEDNGIGRKAAAERRADSGMQHKPKGMLITRKRLELLNRQYSAQAKVEIKDLIDELGKAIGTRVIINTISEEL